MGLFYQEFEDIQNPIDRTVFALIVVVNITLVQTFLSYTLHLGGSSRLFSQHFLYKLEKDILKFIYLLDVVIYCTLI